MNLTTSKPPVTGDSNHSEAATSLPNLDTSRTTPLPAAITNTLASARCQMPATAYEPSPLAKKLEAGIKDGSIKKKRTSLTRRMQVEFTAGYVE